MSSTSIYSSPRCSCIVCRKEFSSKGISKHFLNIHDEISVRDTGKNTQKFITKCSCLICKQETTTQSLTAHINKHINASKVKQCPKCGESHFKPGIFCSRKCGNSRQHSVDTNLKRSNTLKNKTLKTIREKKSTQICQCKVCGKFFPGNRKSCSVECRKILTNIGASKGGKKSAAIQTRRSKDEIELYDLCKSVFLSVSHNETIFNGWDADIIIHDIKTAILWNGPWHYREMGLGNHSLKQVQNRDKIKIQEIQKLGWNILIFEDRYYTPKTAMMQILESNQIPKGMNLV